MQRNTTQKKWDPIYYHANCIMQYRTAMTIVKDLPFQRNMTVLDIGSGPGNITSKVAIHVAKVIGIDADSEMISFSKKTYSTSNLEFVNQDVLQMGYQNFFDFIVSFWTLSWVPNPDLAIKNIIKALKPNGQIYLMYPMRHDAYDVADRLIKDPKWKKYFENSFSPRPFFDENDYRQILSSHPEMNASIKRREIPCSFITREEMHASIRSWMSYVDKLPSEKMKYEFVEEFIEAYRKHRNQKDFKMYFTILEINGTKCELQFEQKKSDHLKSKL